MLFNSLEFVLFLPVVIILYYVLPHKFRWVLLLVASYYFYMCWKVEYIILIIASTLVDYTVALVMERQKKKAIRVILLFASLATNLGLLFSFKYYNFFTDSVNAAFTQFNIVHQLPELNVLLPVGISFYTFQTLSYTIDVYFGKQKAEKHLGIFALYVAYFPQLVAGPIERFSRLAPQLKERHSLTYENIVGGLRLILYGLFIKMVIADNISIYVDEIYNSPSSYNSWSVITGVLFYSFQIYSDFYGYSLIAIGSAQMMGVKIMDNFKTPYLAKGIAEFWQRWHISLSTWFRDYLYFPLGGNRVNRFRWFLNILVVFTVSGLWHGANWTFVFWGALYAIVYLIEELLSKLLKLKKVEKAFSIGHILLALKTFILVTLIWVFFRSEDFSKAIEVLRSLVSNFDVVDNFNVELKVILLLCFFIISDIVLYNSRFDKWCDNKPLIMRWSVYLLLVFALIVFSGVENFAFIYFQF